MSGGDEPVVLGLSFRTAPVEVRERLAVALPSTGDAGRRAHERFGGELVLLSTCNRVEAYAVGPRPEALAAWFAELASTPLGDHVYAHRGGAAVRHLFRVAASLDSMVVGEPQILGQLKAAFEAARTAGTVGALLDRAFSRAFAVGKRVRRETGIAQGAVSVSSVAADLARRIFGDLQGRSVLLVGAGKMGEAAARKLRRAGARLVVVNRSPERAEALARACGGVARSFEALASELVRADVVVTSTSSPRFVLTADTMPDVMRARRHRPLFLVDIAVPRDVDPRVGEVDGVFLYDVDDLQEVAEENRQARLVHVKDAERIVAEEVAAFERWRRSLVLTPTVVALRRRFSRVVRAELERTLGRLDGLSERDRRALEKMADAIVNKLLHEPTRRLREGAEGGDGALLLEAARELFDLQRAEASEAEGRAAASGAAAPSGSVLAGNGSEGSS